MDRSRAERATLAAAWSERQDAAAEQASSRSRRPAPPPAAPRGASPPVWRQAAALCGAGRLAIAAVSISIAGGPGFLLRYCVLHPLRF